MKPYTAVLTIVIAGASVTVPISTQAIAAERVQKSEDGSRYSDRDHMKKSKGEEDKLEQALKTGEEKAFYRREIEKMGWQITLGQLRQAGLRRVRDRQGRRLLRGANRHG